MNCCIKRDTEEIAYENAHILQQKIPRPPNAFMLYANENRKTMAQLYPAESNKEISKRLGTSWKTLEEEEKSKYFTRAKAIDLEHKKKYPNYVYNPKEARLRKAMREATRDRSIGASPMLPRPSARRASHGWVSAHEEQLMMSPMAGMRGGLESPVCFPLSTAGNGGSQFMPPINGYSSGGGSSGKLESPLTPAPPPPSSGSVHTNYMQPSPLAQLQQQTEMWHNYQESIRPSSSGNPYMIPEVPTYQPTPDVTSTMMMDKHHHHHQQRQCHSTNSAASMPMTPPHSNENVPPDDLVPDPTETTFSSETKQVIEAVQPLVENNMQQADATQYMPMYGPNTMGNQQHRFEKVEDAKMKKVNGVCLQGNIRAKICSHNNMYLPLSCTSICASPELLSNDLNYQKEYIAKYFQTMQDYEILNIMSEDGYSFPYATFLPSKDNGNKNDVEEAVSRPNFIQTDVGYIPFYDTEVENVLDLTNVNMKHEFTGPQK